MLDSERETYVAWLSISSETNHSSSHRNAWCLPLLYKCPMHLGPISSPRNSGSRLTPSIAHPACRSARCTLRTSITVGRKSEVIAVAQLVCALLTTAGQEMTPGTRWPPSKVSLYTEQSHKSSESTYYTQRHSKVAMVPCGHEEGQPILIREESGRACSIHQVGS